MENKLIEAGVRNLKEFGYPSVNAENILTDEIYKAFFERMLVGTKEDAKNNPEIRMACDHLIMKINGI